MPGASWWRDLSRVVTTIGCILLLGWLLDLLLPALVLCLVLLLFGWFYQLRRAADWIRTPDRDPPEAGGVWGEIFDGVYHLQRQDREERDRLQTAVSYLRDSLAALKNAAVLVDPAGNIEWCNEAGQRLLGLEYPRDRGQSLLNLVRDPEFHAYFGLEEYPEPLLMDSPHTAEVRLLVEVTWFGKGSRLLFARDVTREERMEEMRRDFVANVSHELRTPLTVITGYLHTLRDSGLVADESLSRPLSQMQDQAHRMENLLKDLLWLSRLESLEVDETENAALDVGELLREVRQECLTAFPERQILVKDCSEQRLRGNYRNLHSAVENLVTNAIKYSDGPVELSWTVDASSGWLSVRDYGAGIDSVHLPRLTERFYRVDKSRSQETGGTGLGLAIVKHILAGHGAYLDIQSTPGDGSRFSCVFPL